MSTLIEQIRQLSVNERIAMVQEVWDDIAQVQDAQPQIPLHVQQEVLRRSAWSTKNPDAHSSLQEIAQRLGVSLIARRPFSPST